MKARVRTRHGDRGVVLLVFAISLTTVSIFAAYVIGSSVGYSARRNAQNAADAAAVAAASRLREVFLGDAAASEVLATAIDVALDNGATPGAVECDVVEATYALTRSESDVIGPCDGTNENDPSSAGIRVRAGDTREVPFGAFVDRDDITASAVATATIQPLRESRSPFMLCAAPSATGHPEPALVADPSSPVGYSVNPDALGESYVLWGLEIKNDGRDCGNGSSSWRGLVNVDEAFPVPTPSSDPAQDEDWWQIETGNKSGQVPGLLAGGNACSTSSDDVEDLAVGCRLLVPACLFGNGQTGSNFRLHCVTMLTFQITYVSNVSTGTAPCHPTQKNNIICGSLLEGAVAAGGVSGAATPGANDAVVIDLVQ